MNQNTDSTSSSLRPFSRTDGFVMTSTLLALSQLASPAATAAAPEKKPEGEGTALPQLVVQADGTKKLYKPEQLSTQKYTVPLRDVPQSVTVIPKEVMKEQGVTNLRDVLKNVPGISMQAGEGGVPPGDNLAIRGFNARTDMFVDGVRDFGGYSRDPFNIEQVEVTKGPSSTNGGRGSTGGSINLSSKMPHLDNAHSLMLGAGTDGFLRSALDVNQEIPTLKGAAVRFNGMFHSQDVAGRDYVEQERWGVAPSITFGLGTETRFTLSYFHLEQNNTPDYGLPWVPRERDDTADTFENNTTLSSGRPGVDDNNWYGLLGRDHEDTKTDILTGIFEHDFNENLKLLNTTRLGQNDIDLIVTAPRFFTNKTLPDGADRNSINRTWKNRDQEDSILSNQTNLRYDFQTGTVKHELVASLEVVRETSENRLREDDLYDDNVPLASLSNPDPLDPYASDLFYNGAVNETTADTFALSLFDTVKINEQWMITGGLRWESFDVDYKNRLADDAGEADPDDLHSSDNMLSYRGAITYKPVQNGSIYLGYGTSFNPSAEGLTLSDGATATNNAEADPEENQTIELGTKWDFLDERLSLTGAIFRTDKTNARTFDPTNDEAELVLDGEQTVQGFEVGFTGLITDQWRIIGGFTHLDSEIKSSENDLEEGNEISNTPENSFSLWTVHDLPKGFQVGIGTQYVDSRYNNNNSQTRQQAPSYTVFDAMIGYQLNENVSFRLNAYNLGDKDYIDRVGGGHYVPGQGRSIVLTADLKF